MKQISKHERDLLIKLGFTKQDSHGQFRGISRTTSRHKRKSKFYAKAPLIFRLWDYLGSDVDDPDYIVWKSGKY